MKHPYIINEKRKRTEKQKTKQNPFQLLSFNFQCFQKITLLFLFLSPLTLFAQSIKDVRINEIQVHNTDCLRDEYGHPVAWIELANLGYNKVNVGGCYLKVNGKEYRIPYHEPKTMMQTRGYLVFYAGGDAEKGPFYTNFTLENTNFVAFYDTDGELVDSLHFNPAEMIENVSYGWMRDHDGKEKLMNLPATTPGSTNETVEKVSRAELFRQMDPSGMVLTITAIAVVTVTLIVLCFVFIIMGNFHVRSIKKKENKAKINIGKGSVDVNLGQDGVITNEELVALAVAFYKYSEDLHDIEDTVLTINRVAKIYSPWSSKIYGLTQTPIKK